MRAANTAIPGVSQVDIFDVEPLAPVYLKGLPDRVPVFRLIDERKQAASPTEPRAISAQPSTRYIPEVHYPSPDHSPHALLIPARPAAPSRHG